MKKVFKNSLIVIAMLGSITSYANLIPTSPKKGIENTSLAFDHVKKGERLIIKSKSGTIIYKEFIKESGSYHKEFDLTSLPNGSYYFELDKDVEIQVIPFIVNDSEVTFKKDEANTIFKPIITTNENLVLLNKLSLNSEPLEVKIFFGSGDYEMILSEEIIKENNIQRVYRLLRNVNGKYKVVCKTEGRTFVTYFEF
ncbi:MAG: hypothetical protein DA407_01895 [Bacteroidetes bacterium]|jgi:hypothetical protein|nr:MAG: hypothetical protein DA407_01895 [Bacteroidota bacterium]